MFRIKKNDTVVVLTGKDRGKKGAVIELIPEKGKVRVQEVAVVTRHVKARRQGQVSAIKKEEACIDLCKIMLFCSTCSKPSRVNTKILENGKKARVCNRCKEII
jgi:large subunit ribosomal protein L24